MPTTDCVTCNTTFGKLWRNGKKSDRKHRASDASLQSDECSISSSDIPSAVDAFKHKCSQAARGIQSSGPRDRVHALVDAACLLVEAILLGIHEHLRDVLSHTEVQIRTFGSGRSADDGFKDIASISVKFDPHPIIGEIATRSRVAVSVRIDRELRFALRAPADLGGRRPLLLRVEGMNLPALPEAAEIRSILRNKLGSKMNPESAFRWWNDNKEDLYPAHTSKFHRVVESLLEQKGMKMLGQKVSADSFWGYLHTTDLNVASFELLVDPRVKPGGIALLAKMAEPSSQQEAEDRRVVKEITQRMLKQNRSSAESLAPSGINVGAMIAGPEVSQPGAKVEVVTKLLSAAQWWGPGSDSWHRHDETWNCTDKKDMLGRVKMAQGRVIWRTEDGPGASRRRLDLYRGDTATASGELVGAVQEEAGCPLDVKVIALFFLSSAIAIMLYSRFADRFS